MTFRGGHPHLPGPRARSRQRFPLLPAGPGGRRPLLPRSAAAPLRCRRDRSSPSPRCGANAPSLSRGVCAVRTALASLPSPSMPAVRPCPLCRWRQALSVRARRPPLRRRCRCAPSAGPGLNRTGRLSRRRRARPLPAPRPREGQVRPRRHVGAVRAKQP